MFFKKPDLSAGSRPELLQDETLILVQNGVGLYEGKFKIAACQNGHAYLTSHRIAYIDDSDPRNKSLSIDLRDVERHDYQAGFLRSSAKITLYPKPRKRGFGALKQSSQGFQRTHSDGSSPVSRTGSPFVPLLNQAISGSSLTGSWICPICSFTNPLPPNINPSTMNENYPLDSCLTCGIKPTYTLVLKAAIAASANRASPHQSRPLLEDQNKQDSSVNATVAEPSICPRCTFRNHQSLHSCEMCGAPLPSRGSSNGHVATLNTSRTESPGPEIADLSLIDGDDNPSAKLSFRAGGDKIFYERLKQAMIQRKWLINDAPPAPRPLSGLHALEVSDSVSISSNEARSPRRSGVGIAGLEQRGMKSREANQTVIGTAFEDLEALMASAKEVVALAEKFSTDTGNMLSNLTVDPLLSQSAAAVGMVATKDIVSDSTNKLYLSELSRQLAEQIDARGLLRRQGGTVSLVNLWAQINRARNGIELISPTDFYKAAELWATLNLPIRLRRFKSGILVVQHRDQNDDRTISQLKAWLKDLQCNAFGDVDWDWAAFGCGVTAQDAALKFGWSLGVASEELEMAEERGALCREEGIQGLKFWLNPFQSA